MELKAIFEVFFNNISTDDFEKLIGDKLLTKMAFTHMDLFADYGHLKPKIRKDLKQYLLENPFLTKEVRNIIRVAFEEYCEGLMYGLPRKKSKKKKSKTVVNVSSADI